MWSYDPEVLGTESPEERKNSVRFLVGDTDESDPQTQDEEIHFALNQSADNLYYAAALVADTIAASYARLVTSEVDRTIRVRYSDRQAQYRALAKDLREQAVRSGGLGVFAGGLNTVTMALARANPTRPKSFYQGKFDDDDSGY